MFSNKMSIDICYKNNEKHSNVTTCVHTTPYCIVNTWTPIFGDGHKTMDPEYSP